MHLFPIVLFFIYIFFTQKLNMFLQVYRLLKCKKKKKLNTNIKLWLAMLGKFEYLGFFEFGDPLLILVASGHNSTIIFKPWVSIVP